ncbi:MAG: hypothetical protein NUW21_08595, partial [Elusimicrobia bacterium]|nr:hypothetical protein [Elusimicrobiota bacterium]
PNPDVQFFAPASVLVNPGSTAVLHVSVQAPASIGAVVKAEIPFEISVITSFLDQSKGFFALPVPRSSSGTLEVIGDVQPPRSSLAIGQPSLGGDPAIVSAETPLSIFAIDDLAAIGDGQGIGVASIQYALEDDSFRAFTGSFTITGQDRLVPIRYFAADLAGHIEAVKASTVAFDASAPVVGFISPDPSGLGLSRLFNGRIDISGTVTDAHLSSYTLRLAAGPAFSESFTVLAVGTSPVAGGLLAQLDSSNLPAGFYTLRLTALDAVGRLSSADVTFFIGQPGVELSVGSTPGLNHPQGAAVDKNGNIWIADTNNDVIRKFSSTGTLLATFDGLTQDPESAGPGKGKSKAAAPAAARFNKPQGIALDPQGNILIADGNNSRVVRLSSQGVVIQAIGKLNGIGAVVPGAQPGQFNHPSDIAVDPSGIIYVADTNNGRVQVLTADGDVIRVIVLPLPVGAAEAKPGGLAVDAQGDLFVSDEANHRILQFDALGNLARSFGQLGSAPGQFDKPQGIRLDGGGVLFVADRNNDRIQRLDRLGNALATLGASGSELGRFNKPNAVSIDEAGNLFVADANNGRIQKLVLGPVTPTVVTLPKGSRRVALPITSNGGQLQHPAGSRLLVPQGAISSTIQLSMELAETLKDADVNKAGRRDNKGLVAVAPLATFGPEGTTFEKPVTVTIPYKNSDLNGAPAQTLRLYYWNPQRQDWELVEDSRPDPAQQVVIAQLSHFSEYQVMGIGQAASVAPAAIDDFSMRDAYAFPNPSRNGAVVTFRMQPGLADSVEVRVYDVSGRRIHSSSNFRFIGAFNDGNGKGTQNTYDHAWDVSGIGSGVYAYVMTARKAGQPDIRKTGKVGVIK